MSETLVVSVTVPKELEEALSALQKVVVDLKAGKSVTEIATTHFADFAKAVDGLNKVPTEVKELPFEAAEAAVTHGLAVVKILMGK